MSALKHLATFLRLSLEPRNFNRISKLLQVQLLFCIIKSAYLEVVYRDSVTTPDFSNLHKQSVKLLDTCKHFLYTKN